VSSVPCPAAEGDELEVEVVAESTLGTIEYPEGLVNSLFAAISDLF
jgi:hypothetical protein